ncbi:unnamed protein product [Parajaminaea phylloscopi]
MASLDSDSDRMSKPLDLGTIPPVLYDDSEDAAQPPAEATTSDETPHGLEASHTRSSTEQTVTPNTTVALSTGLVYSAIMMLHAFPSVTPDSHDDAHPEAPDRISKAFIVLKEHGCVSRMRRVQPREVLRDEVALVHESGVWEGVYRSQFFTRAALADVTRMFGERSSLYINEHTFRCARLSCGGVIELCDAVCSGKIRNGLAIVRPPGHHAEPDRSMGFCLFNNVAVAARWIKEKYGAEDVPAPHRVRKILILDWDVHHGNGTQRAFEEDDEILYISLHRYDNGDFYPCGTYGASASVGTGKGKGFSVNIPWPTMGMGDGEYIYAFHQIVMPIAAEFGPDLVIISAGFDAAAGDPLGGCFVTPVGYAQMTWMLMGLARGKVIVALEGGYNVDSLAMSALAVTRTLLGDPVPSHDALEPACKPAVDAIRLVKRDVSPFWSCVESSPLDPQPIEEEGLAKYSMSELLRAHRQTNIAKRYEMLELPVDVPELKRRYQSHALCSANIMDASPTPEALVLFVHDMGSLRTGNERPGIDLVPDAEATYLVDSSGLVLDWASRRNFAVADVNLFASNNILGERQLRGAGKPANEATEFLEYIWDNYIDLCACRNIIIIAHAGAARPALSLLSSRRLDQDTRVCSISITMGHEAVPMVPKDELDLRKWYMRNGRVYLPETHPWWAQHEEVRRKLRRAGKVVMINETKPIQVLRASLDDVVTFAESKLAARQ